MSPLRRDMPIRDMKEPQNRPNYDWERGFWYPQDEEPPPPPPSDEAG